MQHHWALVSVILLVISNTFMTFAWYGHLKFQHRPLWIVILVSWSIAFFEYCFQVPANRLGIRAFSAAQLKTLQEIITLVVFCFFSVYYLKEPIRLQTIAGFGLMILAALLIFKK